MVGFWGALFWWIFSGHCLGKKQENPQKNPPKNSTVVAEMITAFIRFEPEICICEIQERICICNERFSAEIPTGLSL